MNQKTTHKIKTSITFSLCSIAFAFSHSVLAKVPAETKQTNLANITVSNSSLNTSAHKHSITMYSDPNCGCCKNWVEYMTKEGFAVKKVNVQDIQALKDKHKIPVSLRSCHTSIIDSTGQVAEGHVPAAAIKKLISSPKVSAIAVPGMPPNSPGMGTMNGQLITVDFNNKQFSKD